MLLKIGLVLGLAFTGMVTAAQAAKPMSKSEIMNELVGINLIVEDSSRVYIWGPVRFNRNGTAKGKFDRTKQNPGKSAISVTGTWRISGNKFCIRWKQIRKGRERCSTIHRGSGGRYWSSNGWRVWKR